MVRSLGAQRRAERTQKREDSQQELVDQSARQADLNRILDKARATTGDARASCALLGRSVGTTARYSTAIDRVTNPRAFDAGGQSRPPRSR